MALKTIISKIQDQNTIILNIIINKKNLKLIKQIKAKVHNILCLCQIASMSILYKDYYNKTRQKLNFLIILQYWRK